MARGFQPYTDTQGDNLSLRMMGLVLDGATDESVQANAAFARAAALGIPLMIPGDAPLVASSLLFPSGLTLFGRPGARIIQKDGSAVDDTPFIAAEEDAEDILLQAFTVDGNKSANPGITGAAGLFFDKVTGLRLKDLVVKNVSGSGVCGNSWVDVDIESHKASAWGIGNDYAGIYLLYNGLTPSKNISIRGGRLDGTGSGSCIKLTATEDCPLSHAYVGAGIQVKAGDPATGPKDALAIEFWSGPPGFGGNDISDVLVEGAIVDSEFSSGLDYGDLKWGISLSQVNRGTVANCIVRNCGSYFIELIGSNLKAIGNKGYNVGSFAVIASSIMASQNWAEIIGNDSELREGTAFAGNPLAAYHIYGEGSAGWDRVKLLANTAIIQGSQRGFWFQNNGTGAFKNIHAAHLTVVGDQTTGSFGVVLSNDGGGTFDKTTLIAPDVDGVQIGILRNPTVTNVHIDKPLFGPDVSSNYGGTPHATEMIVDWDNGQGRSLAPPSLWVRGAPSLSIAEDGSFYLPTAVGAPTHFGTQVPGASAENSHVYLNQVSFDEINGSILSVGSYFNGFPNWLKAHTGAYARAMYLGLGAKRFSIRFGNAANANGATPGDTLAFFVMEDDSGGASGLPAGVYCLSPLFMNGGAVLSSGIANMPLQLDAAKALVTGLIDLVSQVVNLLPVTNGGTGSGTASGARTNLSVYSKAEVNTIASGLQTQIDAIAAVLPDFAVHGTYTDTNGDDVTI